MDDLRWHAVEQKLSRSTKRLSFQVQLDLFRLGLLVSDLVCLAAAFLLAYWVRFVLSIPFFQQNPGSFTYYSKISLFLFPAWLILFWLYRLYDFQLLLGGLQEYISLFNACVTGAILIALVQFLSEELTVARGWVGLTWIFTFVIVGLGRFIARRVGYALRRKGYLTLPTLILGVNEEACLLGEQLLSWPTSGLNLIGYLDDTAPVGQRVTASLYVLGPLGQVDEWVTKHGINELILVTTVLPRSLILDIFRSYGTSRDVFLRMTSGLFDILSTGLNIKEMGYVPLIGVNRVRLNPTEEFFKRIVDILIAVGGLAILSPILLLMALLVKLDSRGPAIYRRRVMGLNGKQFDALKFRTMRKDGDDILHTNPELMAELAANHKLRNDPRITRVGAVLRKYSLDELPQLANVLRGEMSLVGPRMISPPELKEYGQWGMNLLTVRPGLTGLWQVSGRSDVSYEERVRLDMFYIRNYSIWLDLQLILRTIPAVLFGKGAY